MQSGGIAKHSKKRSCTASNAPAKRRGRPMQHARIQQLRQDQAASGEDSSDLESSPPTQDYDQDEPAELPFSPANHSGTANMLHDSSYEYYLAMMRIDLAKYCALVGFNERGAACFAVATAVKQAQTILQV